MAKKTIYDILRELAGHGFPVQKASQNEPPKAEQSVAPSALFNTPSYRQIRDAIEKSYDFQAMKSFHKEYLIPFVDQHLAAFEGNMYLIHNYKNTKTPSKSYLAGLIAYLYSNETIFTMFLNWLPKNIRDSIMAIIWHGSLSPEELKVEHGFDVISPISQSYYYDPKAEIKEVGKMFFMLQSAQKISVYNSTQTKRKYYSKCSHGLTYPSPFLEILRTYLPAPILETVENPINTSIFNGEENLVSLFAYALTYIEQGKLEVTKTGKISIAQIVKMQKFLSLPEIFPTHQAKEWANLRATIWADWLALYVMEGYSYRKLEKDILQLSFKDLSKKLWRDFSNNLYDAISLMSHLKGAKPDIESRAIVNICNIIKKLPLNSWIDVQTLWEQETFKERVLIPMQWGYGSQLKIEGEGANILVGDANVKLLLERPFFYANLFAMAAMGWVELAFHTAPPKSTWAVENGLLTDYISYFEILSAIRITPLGAYAMGRSDVYEMKDEVEENVQLYENSLYIFYDGKNSALRSVIEQTARLVGKDLYKVDYESVLGDCSNYKQVQSKINVFQKLLSTNPPQIWKDFFSQLNQKSYELTAENNKYLIFSLPQNAELINTIAREPNLKKFILKAEGYMILIRKKDIGAVKKQLKSYGFLIDFLGTEQ